MLQNYTFVIYGKDVNRVAFVTIEHVVSYVVGIFPGSF